MKISSLIIACLFICLLWGNALADESDWSSSMFLLGNSAYERGDNDSAVSCYQKIIANGAQNAAVYYNLGNALFRKNRLGFAILFYEKARMIDPKDADIEANLRFANASRIDKIPDPEVGFFAKALQRLHHILPLRTTTIITSVLYLMICLVVIFGIYANYNGRLIAVYLGVFLFMCLLPLGVSLSFKIHEHENVKHAIVVSSVVDALNEPDGSQTLFSVHEGAKFRIRKRLEDWVLVSLPNGMAGWVEAKILGEI